MNRAHAAIGWLALGGLWGAISGCGDDGQTHVGVTPPPPATSGAVPGSTSSTSDASGTTAEPACACAIDCTCPAPQICAAGFQVGDPAPSTDAFACQPECVPVGAISQWCLDDRSCCEGTCGDDGLCRTTTDPTGGSGSSSGGDASSSSGSGGSSSDGSSSSGSGGSSSSSSG